MHALEAEARRLERETPGVLAINVAPGYSYADVHDAGLSFGVVTEGDDAAAKGALRRLAQMAWEMREGGVPFEHDLDTVVRNSCPAAKAR